MDAIFCPKCGLERIKNSNFCPRCGFNFNEISIKNNKNYQKQKEQFEKLTPEQKEQLEKLINYFSPESINRKIFKNIPDLDKIIDVLNDKYGVKFADILEINPVANKSRTYTVITKEHKEGYEISIGDEDIEVKTFKYNKIKDPMLAGILSFITPGLGQIYTGHIKRGLVVFLVLFMSAFLIPTIPIIGFILFVIFYIANIVDATKCARAINYGTKLKSLNHWHIDRGV
ncbi:zinc ribbon domain-containing protein [Geobacillus zalihae]|uniref:zinc ribbon domain-containing protein n=1 Tax=Geobacillus zalihae TaxID=213419 RepID=UPI001680FB6B|nr:zinc ribbon domain-containing protein [Geobacillus zalihae]QNU23464.1 zinc ribbon domain-containing protein [Geobacillus zalihae]